jgi:outer membrane murein-binding lipoprotein Lpp
VKIFFAVCILSTIYLSGCSSHDNSYYNRAIQASEKAHDKFDKE